MAETTVHLDTGSSESSLLGNLPKLIVPAIIIVIIITVVIAFRGWSNSPGMSNLASAFGDATSALAWATSHWYLLLAGVLLAPFVPAAQKWAADKASKAIKSKLPAKVQSAVLDAVIYQQATERLKDKNISTEERLRTEAAQAESKARYNDQDSEDRAKSDEEVKKRGIEPVPVEKVTASPPVLKQFLG